MKLKARGEAESKVVERQTKESRPASALTRERTPPSAGPPGSTSGCSPSAATLFHDGGVVFAGELLGDFWDQGVSSPILGPPGLAFSVA